MIELDWEQLIFEPIVLRPPPPPPPPPPPSSRPTRHTSLLNWSPLGPFLLRQKIRGMKIIFLLDTLQNNYYSTSRKRSVVELYFAHNPLLRESIAKKSCVVVVPVCSAVSVSFQNHDYSSDDQAIFCNKLTQGGGHMDPTPTHRFSKWLHIKDQVLASKQLWVNYLLSITTIRFWLRNVSMAIVISQHVRHLGRHLGFFKYLFLANLQQFLLKLVENMCFNIK